jgi:hypothetical protein
VRLFVMEEGEPVQLLLRDYESFIEVKKYKK